MMRKIALGQRKDEGGRLKDEGPDSSFSLQPSSFPKSRYNKVMGTFSRSLALTKQSWTVLKSHPQLALFPIISAIASVLVMASFAYPGFLVFHNMHGRNDMGPAQYGFMFAFYLVSYFVVIFFNVGLVTCVKNVFYGEPATFKDGMRNATSHLGSILLYALIASTVGMILRAVSERVGLIGRIVVSLLGMAWTLITYFVVPVMAVENRNPIDAIKESGAMLKKTWGENIVVNSGINLVFGLLMVLAFIPLIGGIVLATTGMLVVGLSLIIGAVLFFIVMALISATLTGVFQTALYLYARTGQLPNVYDPDVVQYAFRQQRKRGYINNGF